MTYEPTKYDWYLSKLMVALIAETEGDVDLICNVDIEATKEMARKACE